MFSHTTIFSHIPILSKTHPLFPCTHLYPYTSPYPYTQLYPYTHPFENSHLLPCFQYTNLLPIDPSFCINQSFPIYPSFPIVVLYQTFSITETHEEIWERDDWRPSFSCYFTMASRATILTVANITKTCLCNFDPLKPHFYIVKLGFIGVYIIVLISARKHRLWVLVRTASARRF